MALRVGLVGCVVATLWGGCSPYGGGAFVCTEDTQCGAGGKCAEGYCSFPDGACDSGFRYGDLSGPLSNQCVGPTMMVDAAVDTPAGNCYGTGLVTACFADVPTGARTFTSNTFIDTDDAAMCAETTNSSDWCVIAAESIVLNANVFVAARGSRPLVFVATDTIAIDGLVSVASLRAFSAIGAGSNMPGCDAGTPPVGNSGGAGGSFGGAGGAGAAVGTAGMPGAPLVPTTLRGGCNGQPGGDAAAPTGPGEAGNAGGAVYLIADTSITIASSGTINASGEGGGGGLTSAAGGGGGGGSGGMIGFDTPSLTNSGVAIANGGGGGEASGAQSTGAAGSDPSAASPNTAAAGGTGGTSFGTDGGSGAAGATANGGAGAADCTGTCTTPTAGGGGGGGAGIIKLYRDSAISGTGAISPPLS